MSMPIEAFMPCLGNVDVCCTPREIPGDKSCCPQEEKDHPKIISPGAKLDVEFDIQYQGTLFALIGNSENWKVSVWAENLGGIPDANVQKSQTVAHVQTANPQTLKQTVQFTVGNGANQLKKGNNYRMICQVELKVGGVFIVCGFAEGEIFHVSEG
ncbi:MAG TPA: hypothetical protein ENJ20_06085 [Bacteroidetes bacterium]|nr:hypothetical protein [Bacteroidota bacterium]